MSFLIVGRALVLSITFATTACAQYQLSLPAIDLLSDAPSTYQMRDWRAVATNFDARAFNTAATGQFLPLVKFNASPQSPQLQTSIGLAALATTSATISRSPISRLPT
ncbi:MAG: hypothetical protein H0T51_12725 [Pirellulales bacterium]|nr:hypothetical protein [Pirellulales bacterium]